MKLTSTDREVLNHYSRAIYHLRAQLSGKKLMPIFGAGVGRAIGLPDWNALVERIAEHPDISSRLDNSRPSSQASRSQVIFQHFRRSILEPGATASSPEIPESALEDRKIAAKWREVVRDCLYQSAKPVDTHPYLAAFLPTIRKAPLTVNYNFDDSLQELLDLNPAEGHSDQRGFETVWEPTVQYRYTSSVLYHPNGFLPRKLARGPSPSLVFLEDSFADQMIDAQKGHYSTLLSHLFRFTSLLVGLSLADATLKHLLRQCANANPGHVHYYVAYREGQRVPLDDHARASTRSNFETYNLVTLYLSSDEIASLAKLLSLGEEDFYLVTHELGLPKTYTFYLSGAVGVGKTAALSRFKSLNSFDEWLEAKPELVMKAANQLTPEEKIQVDEWINTQMKRRNLLVERTEGKLNIVDRSPIDPVAFQTTEPESSARARELGTLYQSAAQGIAPGQVILLEGSPELMHSRIVDRHKEGTVEYIQNLQKRFVNMWNRIDQGVKRINCVDFDLANVVKRISFCIHLESYEVANMGAILTEFMENN